MEFKEFSEEDEDINWRGVSVREGEVQTYKVSDL